jgi:hypothetical protein
VVHSGADLQAAVALVLGYQQKSIKNKIVTGSPIKEVVTERLTELLQAALASQRLEVRCSGCQSVWVTGRSALGEATGLTISEFGLLTATHVVPS